MANKRATLVQGMKAAATRVAAGPSPAARPGRNRELTDSGTTTAIHIPRDDLALLRRVAVERANRNGGRPSVSDLVRDLIEQHRVELEGELGR